MLYHAYAIQLNTILGKQLWSNPFDQTCHWDFMYGQSNCQSINIQNLEKILALR